MNQLQYGTLNKEVRLAHLNVCSLRNKIEEVRCLQLLCKFEILAITKTHLNKNIPDTEIDIPGMKFVRLDRRAKKEEDVYYIMQNIRKLNIVEIYLNEITRQSGYRLNFQVLLCCVR